MDTLNTTLGLAPVPGTDLITRVTETVDVDIDVPALASDVTEVAVESLEAAAGATAHASRSLAATVRRHPLIALLVVGGLVAAVIAWRRRAGSDEPSQFEPVDAA